MSDLFHRNWGEWETGKIERQRRINLMADINGTPRPRTRVETEIIRRTRVAIWAYAYEYKHKSLVTDGYFDAQCTMIDPNIVTDRPLLDVFFRTIFHPCTGSWIGQHPELSRVKWYYNAHYKNKAEYSDEVLPFDPVTHHWPE